MKKAASYPTLVANRWPKNVKVFFVSAPHQFQEGNSPCGRPRCKSCAQIHVRAGMTFESARTGEKFRARVANNCRTKNIVYLIECRQSRKTVCWGNGEPLIFTNERLQVRLLP